MGQSPLSRFGLGTSFGYGLSRNEGMASIGVANPSPDHVNLTNPALLPFNRNANLEVDLWYTNRRLTIDGKSGQFSGAGPSQLSICLPVHRKMTAAFGIRRFSNREFRYNRQDSLGTDSIRRQNSGFGGTAQAFLSLGYSLSKNLKIGLESGYLFGSLEDSIRFGLLPASTNYESINIEKRKISTLVFKPGIFYQYQLPKYDRVFLSFAGVADLNRTIHYKKYSTTEISGISSSKDTLEDGAKYTFKRANTYTFAVGLYRELEWSLAAEVAYNQGKGANYNEPSLKGINSFGFRLGGEYSAGTEKSTRYRNIITWRAGISHQTLPYTLNGATIKDQKVSVGASFPIVRKETKFTRPLVNLAVSLGQRGLKDTYLGLERYWQITLGFTLNDTQWFTRYRVD